MRRKSYRPDQERGGLQSWPPHEPTLVAPPQRHQLDLDMSYEAGLADGAEQYRRDLEAALRGRRMRGFPWETVEKFLRSFDSNEGKPR